MKIKKVFKLSKATELISMGNKVKYTEPNRKIPFFTVFCFENTNKLQNDWSLIVNK